MKRLTALLLVLVMLLSAACAEYVAHDDYTDVPTAMTQDSVIELTADEEGCLIEYLQPDEESIALLDDVYRFVWEEIDRVPDEINRPARYYDEETQKKIAKLAGCDIDILHMTEAMRLQLSGMPIDEKAKEITAEMLLDVDYHIGQLIVVVMGIPQYPEAEEEKVKPGNNGKHLGNDKGNSHKTKEPGKKDKQSVAEGEEILPEDALLEEKAEYIWYPYRGRVEETGEIEWDIPLKDWIELSKQPVSFHVLTNRIGPRGERIMHEEQYKEKYDIFSKDSGDVIKTRRWYSESGEPIEDNFRVWTVELTEPMLAEVQRIALHLEKEGLLMDYFPEERRAEAMLMLPEGIDPETLIAYDIIALQDEEYKDTYGDVTAEIDFATEYSHEKAMVVLAGFPIEDYEEWLEEHPEKHPEICAGKPEHVHPEKKLGKQEEEPLEYQMEALAEETEKVPAEEEYAERLHMEWFVLRAEAVEPLDPEVEKTDRVEIGLKQLNLPRMMEEPMMLIVISENLQPIEEVTAEEAVEEEIPETE